MKENDSAAYVGAALDTYLLGAVRNEKDREFFEELFLSAQEIARRHGVICPAQEGHYKEYLQEKEVQG